MARTTEQTQNLKVNSIVEGTKLKGEIKAPGNFRIDGEVQGDMTIEGKLIIGTKGVVNGTVICRDAEIEGNFDGNLKVNGLLSLKSTAVIKGDTVFERLMVAEGAKLSCTCNLKQAASHGQSTSPKVPGTSKAESAVERGMSAIR